MKLTISLHTDEMVALRRAAHEHDGSLELEAVAALLLRDALIAAGYLELPYELDAESETAGEA